ncbi:hypothetical protein [Pseudoteredinibacter isoporae]|uniref:Uncharacterized protein n=1 Tax=Pseudoteredinibacter isoporae TaxID=570281 RepID=A0A7X0JYA6_9GAMM|nr:hypothetical protein [Pseudoteredinibacter isoporae]MBB6523661.1 hypothetical protein [Pseudoteredinibacter isoporae]NHO89165.1 hypothetical protein [Pseudoteredinibacter isoporae]NIB22224.1 hypothetical protein [Pseudoteredinibacter isoporae]
MLNIKSVESWLSIFLKRSPASVFVKRSTVLVSFLVLTACSSIPLGTAWQYRNHGIDDLMALSPESIRAKVQSSEQLIVSQTRLSFTVEFEGKKNDYQFPLEIIEQKQIARENWLGQRHKEEYSEWKISQSGVEDFKRLQQDWQKGYAESYQPNSDNTQEKTMQLGFGVSSQFTEDSNFKDGYFSVWLKLSDDKDYQLFIDEHPTNDIHKQIEEKRAQTTEN